ncbi:AAA family ATPase [Photorhabdus sp. RM96S]|uniref:AAA family ATPase n=1 Tax=Photorhabdus sp. RM96S TaxID=3342822 RepID=UPI0036DC5AB9
MTHRPQLWVIAGPNGAGKSTLVRRHLTGKVPVVNPDDIARELSLHNPSLKNAEAGRLAIKQRAVFLQECRSFAVETTLTGKGEIKLMEQAVSAGYKVNFIFVGVHDVGLSAARVALRVRAGGHNVPVVDIFRRYDRSIINLPLAMNISDRVWIFDNSNKRRQLLLARDRDRVKQLSSYLPEWFRRAASNEIISAQKLKKS